MKFNGFYKNQIVEQKRMAEMHHGDRIKGVYQPGKQGKPGKVREFDWKMVKSGKFTILMKTFFYWESRIKKLISV